MIEHRVFSKHQRDEWLGWRKQYLNASSIAAIFGRHPYVTPLKLYLQMRGVEFPPMNSRLSARGLLLEPAVIKGVSELQPDWTITSVDGFDCYADTEAMISATLDAKIQDPQRGLGILELKTTSRDGWERLYGKGEDIPFQNIAQTLVGAKLYGGAFAYMGVLVVDPYDTTVHLSEIPIHDAAWQVILAGAKKFMADVRAGREPEADYGRDAEAIRALTRTATADKAFDATGHNELPIILAQRAALQARIKQDKARCDEIENEVKHLLGDAVTVSGLPDWRVTFKPTDFKEYTVKARTARSLRIIDKRPAAERPDGGEDGVAA